MEEKVIDIQIRGVYDGICVKYYPETKEFIWREVAIQRTTEEYRKQFEQNIIKQYKEQQDEK